MAMSTSCWRNINTRLSPLHFLCGKQCEKGSSKLELPGLVCRARDFRKKRKSRLTLKKVQFSRTRLTSVPILDFRTITILPFTLVLELSRSCPPHPFPVLEFRDVDRAVTDRAVTKHRFFDAPVHTVIFFPKIIIVIETAPRCVRGTEKVLFLRNSSIRTQTNFRGRIPIFEEQYQLWKSNSTSRSKATSRSKSTSSSNTTLSSNSTSRSKSTSR
ncbi:unnamed protein product [Nesidiocoris tenuis]|uniref:Uncharacterized protein n=1 Tax=Nesidiocoris tenuis TaxID=355587 RepID=A0A6H5H9G4_9HEMI|nr:unnamed protein product [Nesidiocoris tenuis]